MSGLCSAGDQIQGIMLTIEPLLPQIQILDSLQDPGVAEAELHLQVMPMSMFWK